jgi:glutamyl-tRNA synthetase
MRTRFAPSPTGFVHIGSLRTALFSFLLARHNNGTHVLRIEDTDQNRLVEGAIENLLRVMKTMGVEFDEGYYLNDEGHMAERGSHGPYVQSQRLELYHKHALELIASGDAYYCFCDQQRLDDLRKEQTALKKPPMYDRHCRNLSPEQIASEQERVAAEGRKPVIRQAIPLEGKTVLDDLIYGEIVFDNNILDDQIIVKQDGFPTYHLAVVVDDHYMEISHVVRGEEWISSTPKHLLLYKSFGWMPTAFAHLPLILNKDKSKLSKRQGDVAVEDFIANGYLPEAVVNFVAFLGWNPKTEQELFSMAELVEQFDLAKINKSPAILDQDKLDWMNGLYIRHLTDAELTDLLVPFWQKQGIEAAQYPREYLEKIVALEKERLKKLSDIGEGTAYFFNRPKYDPAMLVWKKSTAQQTAAVLKDLHTFFADLADADFGREELELKLKAFIAEKQYDNGTVLWPLRAALTGLEKSPGPFEVASILFSGHGKQEILDRIQEGFSALS